MGNPKPEQKGWIAMLTSIKTFFIWIFPYIKKIFKWSVAVENREYITRLISYKDDFKKFTKTGNPWTLVQIGKKLSNNLPNNEIEYEAEKITKESGDINNLKIGFDSNKGIVVKALGLEGSWNPKDGSGYVGYDMDLEL